MTSYGAPYKGSKNNIAKWVVKHFPPAHTFVDLFAGGGAVTHCAILSNKFEEFIMNDLGKAPDIFLATIKGEFEGYSTVPTREEFFASEDEALKLIYSFGNNSNDYLWSKEIEGVKYNASKMVMASSVWERKKAYSAFINSLVEYLMQNEITGTGKTRIKNLQSMESIHRLQSIERIDRINHLSNISQNIIVKHLDYRSVEIPNDSLVYADPPYRNTNCDAYCEAGKGFDFESFDKWLACVPFPVIVSEYTCPNGCVLIDATEKIILSDTSNRQTRQEGLFIQERFYKDYLKQMKSIEPPTLFDLIGEENE